MYSVLINWEITHQQKLHLYWTTKETSQTYIHTNMSAKAPSAQLILVNYMTH